jgi:hypothetical protein
MYDLPIRIAGVVGPLVAAVAFVCIMSFVYEPTRRQLNAILAAGAVGAYLSGGFGVWELAYLAVATPIVYLGLRSHRYIGIAWLMHACWDIAHHLYGNPIWPFLPRSSFGCLIFDSAIAVWFLAGAPSLLGRGRGRGRAATHAAVTGTGTAGT